MVPYYTQDVGYSGTLLGIVAQHLRHWLSIAPDSFGINCIHDGTQYYYKQGFPVIPETYHNLDWRQGDCEAMPFCSRCLSKELTQPREGVDFVATRIYLELSSTRDFWVLLLHKLFISFICSSFLTMSPSIKGFVSNGGYTVTTILISHYPSQ